jgi:hypothetical protein
MHVRSSSKFVHRQYSATSWNSIKNTELSGADRSLFVELLRCSMNDRAGRDPEMSVARH